MSLIMVYIAYGFIGALSGVLGGMLGIGGGIITVPCLLFLFHYIDIPQTYIMHMAIATSLAAMIFNTFAATRAQNKRKAVVWDVFKKLLPGIVVGSLIGAFIALWLSSVALEIFFGVFLLTLAIRFYFQRPASSETHKLPHPFILNLFSASVGALSNLLGIGGGSVTVPILTSFKMQVKNAIGTSSAVTLVTTVCGTITYLILGIGVVPRSDTIGLINIPAFLIIGIVAFLAAPYGVKLTHEINPAKVRKIFAIVLALTGLSFFI